MKELSIEEKAKRYDEAVEIANKINNEQRAQPFDVMLKVFPELKESDDDKIRKHLISLFEKFVTLGVANECETSEIKVDDILSWLEKQYKKDEEIILLKDKIESLESARIAMQECHRLELEKLEKQVEHHIVCSEEQMKVLDEVLNFAANHENPYWNNYIFETLNNLIRQLKKLKAYDSDKTYNDTIDNKDEKIRKALINIFATHKDYEIFFGVSVENIVAWLEKQGNLITELQKTYAEIGRLVKENYYLKEKQGEQKPVEWSGVDNVIVEGICLALEYSNESGGKIEKYENWLHSIKDRAQPKQEWSEEDKEKINSICNIISDKMFVQKQAYKSYYKSLINFLKSLRPQNMWINVDEGVYIQKPVLAQKKDKSDQFKGYVVCCNRTLTPNVYERYVILDNIVSQNT